MWGITLQIWEAERVTCDKGFSEPKEFIFISLWLSGSPRFIVTESSLQLFAFQEWDFKLVSLLSGHILHG